MKPASRELGLIRDCVSFYSTINFRLLLTLASKQASIFMACENYVSRFRIIISCQHAKSLLMPDLITANVARNFHLHRKRRAAAAKWICRE